MFTEIVAAGTKSGIQIYDLRRGTKLAQSLGVSIEGRQGFGMCATWVAAANTKKPMCHVYMLNRGDTGEKLVFPFPEEITCVHVLDEEGRYIAAGAKSGRIMIWSTASGRMLRSWDAHYGAVVSLASGEGILLSGGEDAAVHIWVLSQVLDQSSIGDTAVIPAVSLTEHTLAITAVYVAQAAVLSGRSRVYTASKDHTCKQWRVYMEYDGEKYVGKAELLATFLYPGIINDIVVDKGETRVFAATAAGLYQTNLFAYRKFSSDDTTHNTEVELLALGGTGGEVFSEHHCEYPIAEARVVAVALNFDGTLLVSATAVGDIRVWDVASRQCLRTINDKQLNTGVTQLSVRLAPPQLAGPRALVIAEQPVTCKISAISFAPLQRLAQEASAKTTTAFEASVKQKLADSTTGMACFENALHGQTPYSQTSWKALDLLEELRPSNNGSSSEQKIADLLQQIERLQKHHARTRRLNDELYQGAVTEWLGTRQRK
ncbi:WD40-repeat-containing domain protein [Coemansia spiralis]|nr:WD40-repeat-containing domain protein [Coemansia spiralis]